MINRRRFLRGMFGVTVALPFLESLGQRSASADMGDVPPFAIFMRQANGVVQQTHDEPEEMFWPRQPGALNAQVMEANQDRAVSELKDYASKLILVRGINFAFNNSGCGHSGGGNQCLTAARVSTDPSGNRSLAMGESIDNRIAKLQAPNAEPLTLYAGKKRGYIDEVLSYRGPKDLRSAEADPYKAYQKLFGLSNVDAEIKEKLRVQRVSVNDLISEELTSLKSRADLSKSDRERLDLHFQSIRDVENALACGLPSERVEEMEAISAFSDANENIETVARMQMDIIVLAVACGHTRAATIQIGNGNDQTEYTIDGVRQKSFHKISHRVDSDGLDGPPIAGARILHHKIDRLHGRLFKYLLDRLSERPSGTGTLLDQGVAVWLNDLADKHHSYHRVPYVLAGDAKGALKTGQFVDVGRVSNNKLLNTIGAAVGCKNGAGGPLDDFGDPSLPKGLLSELMA